MNPEELPLRDLHLPAEIGWWPLAPGWWFLAVLLLVGIVYLALQFWRNWRRAAARREALAEFSRLRTQLDQDGDIPGFVAAVSTLLRRAMLAYGERQHVAVQVDEDRVAVRHCTRTAVASTCAVGDDWTGSRASRSNRPGWWGMKEEILQANARLAREGTPPGLAALEG